MRFTLSERDPGIVVGMDRVARRNEDVVRMFLEDSFPKDRRNVWGTEHLKITKSWHGWELVNYNTTLLYRDSEGNVFWDDYNYSPTTSKIQSYIRRVSREVGITIDVVSGRSEMAEEIRRKISYEGGYVDVHILHIEESEEGVYEVTFESESMDVPQTKVVQKNTLESMTMEELTKYIEEG